MDSKNQLLMGAMGLGIACVAMVGVWVRMWMKDKRMQRVDALKLYVIPTAEEVAQPPLADRTAVPLRGFNILPAYISRQYCELFVDSGTTSPLIKRRRARKLGLLKRVSCMKLVKLQLWDRYTVEEVYVVEGVEVQLSGGVTLHCTVLVVPDTGALSTLKHDIFLDNATLRHARAIQTFSPAAAVLHFPNPMPDWAPRSSPDSQYEIDNVRPRNSPRANKLKVHVDTGAYVFYVSKKYPLAKVKLLVGREAMVEGWPVRTTPSKDFDFVLGKSLLSKYSCVLDYAGYFLYFNINNKVYRVKLRKSYAV